MRYDHREFLKALGMRVKAFRKERGWTLRDMIVTHRYHQTAWQRIERGDGMTIPTLLRLCELFEMSVSELLNGLGDAPLDDGSVKRILAKGKKKAVKKMASTR